MKKPPIRVSERQRDIIFLLSCGLRAKQIADHIIATKSTVEKSISRLLAANDLGNSVQLVAYALMYGVKVSSVSGRGRNHESKGVIYEE